MFKKTILSAFAMAALVAAQAQDSTKASKPTISGWVDAYYRYNLSDAPNNLNTGGTSFTNSQNSFELGMVSLKAAHEFGKVSVVGDLGFGKRAEEFSYADANTLFAVKQAYVSYAVTDKFKITAGKWATHIGYELVDAPGNRNYSMSYMFSYGPFSHTGVKADFTLGGGSGLMIGVANPTDVTAPTSAPVKTLLAQYSYVGSKTSFFINYQGYFGAKRLIPTQSSLNQFGLTLTTKVSDKFGIGYDGTIQIVKDEVANKSKNWWGSALYFNYDPTSVLGFTLRTEYFADEKDALKVGANVFQTTLSANIKKGNLTFIPEFRFDNASNTNVFNKSNGTGVKGTPTLLLAAVYSF